MPLARRGDPVTSHIAGQEIIEDGTRESMQRMAVMFVSQYPGYTSNELEEETGFTDGKLRKRLSEVVAQGLVKEGEVRRSKVTGKLCKTYWPVEED